MARSRRAAPARRPAPAPARRPASTQAAKPPAPAPTPAATPPAPMQQPSSGGGGMLSGIGSTIAQGMAFGTGSAIAHQAVGAIAGSFSGGGSPAEVKAAEAMPPATPQQADACTMDRTNLFDCLKHNEGDTGACQFLFDQLKNCQQQAQFQQY